MSLKSQVLKAKENWLLILIFLLLIICPVLINNGISLPISDRLIYSEGTNSSKLDFSSGSAIPTYIGIENGFAPQIEDRKLTKTSELATEIKKGGFVEAQEQLKNIISASGSFLLSENVNKLGEGIKEYYRGQYQLKTAVDQYTEVIAKLKAIGKIQNFNENTVDITANYANLQIELEVEQSRLQRYQDMYKQAVTFEDKINLNDRIFNQEKTIKYYEDRLNNLENKIDYSTINLTLTEKKSSFYYAQFVKFSELIRIIVGSFNSLLMIIFAVIPYIIVLGSIYSLIKLIKRHKKR